MTQKATDRALEPRKGEDNSGLDKTIFHSMINSDLPAAEKEPRRMLEEGLSIISAGSETAANILVVTHFHLPSSPDVLAKLQAELREALPSVESPVELRVVEKLPYLVSLRNSVVYPATNKNRLLLLMKD